jgi:endothelin-converting enzyme/putative endopeptidase
VKSASLTLSRLRGETFSFYRAYLNGVQEMKPRWKRAWSRRTDALGEALGRKYVEKHFPPAAKARMQDMVKNILLAMGDTVRGLDWMTPATKQKALEKLATFNPKIGYPDRWKDYGACRRRDAFFGTRARPRASPSDGPRAGRQAGRPRPLAMTPPTSNAYYNPLLNEIVFPAGILQPPGFDWTRPTPSLRRHRRRDRPRDQPRLRRPGRASTTRRAACQLVDARGPAEFEARAVRGRPVRGLRRSSRAFHNGKLVLGESIGDLAGVKIAYRAT